MSHVLFALFFLALLATLAGGGGWAVLSADPTLAGDGGAPVMAATALASGALAAGLGAFLAWRLGRRLAFLTVLWGGMTVLTLALCELAASFLAPPWPARGLHGLDPARPGPWAQRAPQVEGGVGINGWGQRDHPHETHPPAGKRRVVFIGDSFLEESTTRPLPVAVQAVMAMPEVETVNLGVSATDPDEYYWRLRHIGLALAPERVVVVIYAGNDFIGGPTMPTFLGLAAPYPRDSLLRRLGLGNLNHALTNHRRPMMRAWQETDLAAREAELEARVKKADNAAMPALLAGLAPALERQAATDFLGRLELSTFYEGLRNPDGGLFRSHYLRLAMETLGPPRQNRVAVNLTREEYVLRLVERMAELCRERNVDFTLALAPEASHVDPRFRAFWGRVSHLAVTQSSEKALAARLAADARAKGIEVVELAPDLEGIPGTYYNLDGHWSALGVETAARSLGGFLRIRLQQTPAR